MGPWYLWDLHQCAQPSLLQNIKNNDCPCARHIAAFCSCHSKQSSITAVLHGIYIVLHVERHRTASNYMQILCCFMQRPSDLVSLSSLGTIPPSTE